MLKSHPSNNHEVSILGVREGSVKVTLEVCIEQAEQIMWLHRRGVLNDLNIKDVDLIGHAAANAIVNEKLKSNRYDVFMCHNSCDKDDVKRIAIDLRKFGILPWLDEWELRPGIPWQRVLEEQIEKISSVAVCVGNDGIGPWQNMELEAFIRKFVERNCPVIPVLLKKCKSQPMLPTFLRGMTWVNFTKRKPDSLNQLVWGITGIKTLTCWV